MKSLLTIKSLLGLKTVLMSVMVMAVVVVLAEEHIKLTRIFTDSLNKISQKVLVQLRAFLFVVALKIVAINV